MRLTSLSVILFPALAYALEVFTLSGWIPISTIYPTETASLSGAQPKSVPTNTQALPSPTSTSTSTSQTTYDAELQALLLSLSQAGFVPISTIIPTAVPTPSPAHSKSETEPIAPGEEQQVRLEDSSDPHQELRVRQQGGLGGGPAAAPSPGAVQLSPITTIYIGTVLVVYSQAFSAVPSQFSSAQVGSIGLGTLTGSVGVVKTQEAVNRVDSSRHRASKELMVGIALTGLVALWLA
ncbi:MAG: hypothetical protein MMC33_004076 [Icmadophila ericetorum]|nr:hypothetical protein [Icmadophila ericetorum]